MDPVAIATAAGNPGLVIALSISGAMIVAMGVMLWWFMRDKMRTKEKALDERLASQELRERIVKEERDKRDAEVQKFREMAEDERHQATKNHYQSLEGRLQAGSQTFRELQETQKRLQHEIQTSNTAFKELLLDTNKEFQSAIQAVRDSLIAMAHTFIRRDDFAEYKKDQEASRKHQEEQLSKIKESQAEVIAQMKHLNVQFEVTIRSVNSLFSRVIDEHLLLRAGKKEDCIPSATLDEKK
jgi:hypothetical protein